MRLKRLELQGYKTFAAKTEFVFDGGITAIVGPNGSGKSNIADAVRWVLGEQSYSILRGKRTEDMIFHGSEQRSRLGMAAATIVLDNSDGGLPLDFSEVSITRRATRDGENEYYLNSSRVRLRDITDLLAASGLGKRTYAVIGQGLVDLVLSLRPDERRALIEEAAGITGHQVKRSAALAKLDETQKNLLRVADIISEIEPRLKSLRRQADQARHYRGLAEALAEKSRVLYGYQWRQAQRAFQESRDRHELSRQRLVREQELLQNLSLLAAETRANYEETRARLAGCEVQLLDTRTQAESVNREIAVAEERARLIDEQRLELEQELQPLEANRLSQEQRAVEAEQELVRLTDQWRALSHGLSEVEARDAAERQARQGLLARVTRLQDEALAVASQLSDRRNRLLQLLERRAELQSESQERSRAREQLASSLSELESGAAAALHTSQEAEQAAMALQKELDSEQSAFRSVISKVHTLDTEIARLVAQEASLDARRGLLARMRDEASGYYPGVRSVLGEARAGRLAGVVGVLSELIKVPARLEKAVEAALGAHLQDIVTETWEAAEQAIQMLRTGGSGRATFLPLAALRPPRPMQTPNLDGLVGVADTLVSAAPNLAPVLELLLGNTLIVNDLRVARGAFHSMRGSFRIVTLDGDIVRSTGEMTGGTPRTVGPGLLSRQREWDALPAEALAMERRRASLEGECARAGDERPKREAAVRTLTRRVQESQGQAQKRAALARQLAQDSEGLRRQMRWLDDLVAKAAGELKALEAKEAILKSDIDRLASNESAIASELGQSRKDLDESSDRSGADAASARTVAALAKQRAENQEVVVRTHRNSLAALDSQLASKKERLSHLIAETDRLARRLDELSSNQAAASLLHERQAESVGPLRRALADSQSREKEMESQAQTLRERVRQLEAAQNQTLLDTERRRSDLLALQKEIDGELGPTEMEAANGITMQAPLPLRPVVGTLPVVDRLPEGLQEETQELRAQIRRAAGVNPNAPLEYEEAQQRHSFLESQSEDLQQAARSLRSVVSELDQRMHRDFLRTFAAASQQFKGYFATLFGGGSARIELTDPDDPASTGIDIVARPPGRRMQPLSMLSGGERALTAAALIFAILKVSPTPFCVLDEVDATLDESNVRRFREVLSELAAETQFIVITHNRGTVEAAKTIYGVSMGQDAASRVVSLRLDEVAAKA